MEEYLKRYREIAEKEMRGEKPRRPRAENPDPASLVKPERPFFRSLDPHDDVYVSLYRAFRYELEKLFGLKATYLLLFNVGKRLGYEAVENGVVKSLDDLPKLALAYKVGLLDLYADGSNKARVHVYESILGAGSPHIGRTLCHFEAGLVSGVMEKLVGRNRVGETHCWGTGYSFCGFDVYFL
ncbi:V4R domain-containing protein [Thermofilum pendens]